MSYHILILSLPTLPHSSTSSIPTGPWLTIWNSCHLSLVGRSWSRCSLRPPQYDFNYKESYWGKNAGSKPILGGFWALMGSQDAQMLALQSLELDETNFWEEVGLDIHWSHCKRVLTITCNVNKNAAVKQLFWAVSGLWCGPQGPKICDL